MKPYKVVLALVAVWVAAVSSTALVYEYLVPEQEAVCPAPAPRYEAAPFVYEEPARRPQGAAGA